MAREYEPVAGQWYENIDENESFRVLSVDEDSELIEIEYLDGELEELDLDSWQELDLEKIEQPEGWSSSGACSSRVGRVIWRRSPAVSLCSSAGSRISLAN